MSFYFKEVSCICNNKKNILNNISLNIKSGEFVLVCGDSGSGKSTFARLISGFVPKFYDLRLIGSLKYKSKELLDWKDIDIRKSIGIVFQVPERQILTNSVYHEIAFGLENLGKPESEIRKIIYEVSSITNCINLLHKNPKNLSSGEKQKVVIAATVAMSKDVLVLDEPTSHLDYASANEIISLLKTLSVEWGYTIILVEHRFDECFKIADKVLILKEGELLINSEPKKAIKKVLFENEYKNLRLYSPEHIQFFYYNIINKYKDNKDIPLSVLEVVSKIKEYNFPIEKVDDAIESFFDNTIKKSNEYFSNDNIKNDLFLELKNIGIKNDYGVILNNVNLSLKKGHIISLLGANGQGKTTLLESILDSKNVFQGKIKIFGKNILSKSNKFKYLKSKIGYLPQNSLDYFFCDSVLDEVNNVLILNDLSWTKEIDLILEKFNLVKFKHYHPKDLSIGKQHILAFVLLLITNPEILLIDEPTLGMDPYVKLILIDEFRELAKKGKSILLVTQDLSFCARVSNSCSLLLEGSVNFMGDPFKMFKNSYLHSPTVFRVYNTLKYK